MLVGCVLGGRQLPVAALQYTQTTEVSGKNNKSKPDDRHFSAAKINQPTQKPAAKAPNPARCDNYVYVDLVFTSRTVITEPTLQTALRAAISIAH